MSYFDVDVEEFVLLDFDNWNDFIKQSKKKLYIISKPNININNSDSFVLTENIQIELIATEDSNEEKINNSEKEIITENENLIAKTNEIDL